MLLCTKDRGRRACGRLQREEEGRAVWNQLERGPAHGGRQDRQNTERQEHTCLNPRHSCTLQSCLSVKRDMQTISMMYSEFTKIINDTSNKTCSRIIAAQIFVDILKNKLMACTMGGDILYVDDTHTQTEG